MTDPIDLEADDGQERRIYFVGGRCWMVLTYAELQRMMREAPDTVELVNGDPCTEVVVEHRRLHR